jgi:hypothetical protein
MPAARKINDSEVRRKRMRSEDMKPKELKGNVKLNNDMKKLLLALGIAQKPKASKAIKMVKPKRAQKKYVKKVVR